MYDSVQPPLSRADGSATHSHNGYTVICAVNGPMEVQRREELPDEAVIDVSIRPATGFGGVQERHMESIIHSVLRHIVLITAHARTLIQVTLQLVAEPERESSSAGPHQSSSNILALPALLQASVLALLSTSISLSMVMSSVSVVVAWDGGLTLTPSITDVEAAASLHVLAFSSHGDLVLAESEGSFDRIIWERVLEAAERACRHNKESYAAKVPKHGYQYSLSQLGNG